MPIRYACINDGTNMVAEFPSGEQPKLAETLQLVLSKVPPKEYRRKTIEDAPNGLQYHYLSNGEGRIVACAATSDVKMRTVFAFLEAVEPVVRGPSADLRGAKRLLQQKLEYYNNPANDKISALNQEINDVKEVMMDNMDKVLARGDRVDTLAAKSTTLAEQADQFQKRSTELKRAFCMRNAKLTAMIVGSVLVTIVIILFVVCKPNFSDCS
jgi:vesicle-associated membrane protein 7